ncbi:Fc.00g055660.m01.CDS01 [Cosmosporella sp. VM-42]
MGLAVEGSLDVGCGTYKYQVYRATDSTFSSTELPTETPTITETPFTSTFATIPTVAVVPLEFHGSGYFNEEDLPGRAQISEGAVESLTSKVCLYYKDTEIRPNGLRSLVETDEDVGTNKHEISFAWRENCIMDSNIEQSGID